MPTGFDTKGVRAFAFASGSTFTAATEALLLPQYTTVNAAGTKVKFVFNAASGSANLPHNVTDLNTVFYNEQPKDFDRGDFEDNSGGGFANAQSTTALSIPEIDVKMKSEAENWLVE